MAIDRNDYIRRVIQHIQREKENITRQKNDHEGDVTEFVAAIVVFDTMMQELSGILSGYWWGLSKRITPEEGLRLFFAKWRKQESDIHERGEWNNRDIPRYDRGNNGAILWFLHYCDMFRDKEDPGHIWEYCHIERDKIVYDTFQFRAEEERHWLKVVWQSQVFTVSRGLFRNRNFDPDLMNHQVASKAWERLVDDLLADGWEILDPIGNYVWWRRTFRRKPR